jgi:beta-mannosidase
VEDNPYAYRLELMIKHVERIFGNASPDLDTFARQSQISQAEAKKYFIENFRIKKGDKTGILWWNIIDGWPQVSDAVTDWYGVKKLACHYIKRSQQPFCLLCAEPVDGIIDLIVSNEKQAAVTAEYTVTDLTDGEVLAAGTVSAGAHETLCAAKLPEKHCGFYLITWKTADGEGQNHFVCNIGDGWTYEAYKVCMEKAGFWDEFEGF